MDSLRRNTFFTFLLLSVGARSKVGADPEPMTSAKISPYIMEGNAYIAVIGDLRSKATVSEEQVGFDGEVVGRPGAGVPESLPNVWLKEGESCVGDLQEEYVLHVLALEWVIRTINEESGVRLPLGLRVYDTCSNSDYVVRHLVDLIQSRNGTTPLLGVVPLGMDDMVRQVTEFLHAYSIPVIITMHSLMGGFKNRDNLFSTTPQTHAHMQAILKALEGSNPKSPIGVIASSEGVMKTFTEEATKSGFLVGAVLLLDEDDGGMESTVEEFLRRRVGFHGRVICLLDESIILRLSATLPRGLIRRSKVTWVFTPPEGAYDLSDSKKIRKIGKTFPGALIVSPASIQEPAGLRNYLKETVVGKKTSILSTLLHHLYPLGHENCTSKSHVPFRPYLCLQEGSQFAPPLPSSAVRAGSALAGAFLLADINKCIGHTSSELGFDKCSYSITGQDMLAALHQLTFSSSRTISLPTVEDSGKQETALFIIRVNPFGMEEYQSFFAIVFMVLGTSGVIATTYVAVFVAVHYYEGTVTGPQVLGVLNLVGTLLTFASVFLFVLPPTKTLCLLRPWAVYLPLSLSFGVLLIKAMWIRASVSLGIGGQVSQLNFYMSLAFIVIIQVVLCLMGQMNASGVAQVSATEFNASESDFGPLALLESKDNPSFVVPLLFPRADKIVQLDSSGYPRCGPDPWIDLGCQSYLNILVIMGIAMGIANRGITTNYNEGHYLLLASYLALPTFLALLLGTGMSYAAPALVPSHFREVSTATSVLILATVVLVFVLFPKVKIIASQASEFKHRHLDAAPVASPSVNLSTIFNQWKPPQFPLHPPPAFCDLPNEGGKRSTLSPLSDNGSSHRSSGLRDPASPLWERCGRMSSSPPCFSSTPTVSLRKKCSFKLPRLVPRHGLSGGAPYYEDFTTLY